jgi:hypothetical protein
MRKVILRFSAVFMLIFGLVTMIVSVSFMFNLFEIRKPEDHYVFFIFFISFLCSFIYLFAAYGFYKEDKRTTIALFIAASILILAFMGLLVYIMMGGLYEIITIRSLMLRTFITIVFTIISWNCLVKQELVIS